MSRRTRLLSAGALSTVLAAGALAAGPGTAGAAPDAEPVITLRMPDTIKARSHEGRTWLNLGLHAITGTSRFEVQTKRLDYEDPLVTSWTSGERSGTLPTGTQRTFRALRKFVRVIIRNDDGEKVAFKQPRVCLSGGGSRVRPDGEPHNPYPWGCFTNPYGLGMVQGIPAGWAAPIAYGVRANLEPGTYRVHVKVRRVWARSLGLSPAERRVASDLVVTEGRNRQRSARMARAGGDDTLEAGREPSSQRAGRQNVPTPNLRSLPAFGMELNRKGTQLRFGATVWNAGPSPLVIDGFRREGEDVMDAYQYFFDTNGDQVGYEQIGELRYHKANHRHWHFQDFARYRLLDADQQPVRRSRKASFCLANTDAVDYTVPGADWRPDGTDLSSACGGPEALSIREVLSTGSGDTYFQFRAGQAIRVKGLPNGVYYLAVEANPFDNIIESDTTDNVSLRKIRLRGAGENRRVIVPQLGLVDDGRW